MKKILFRKLLFDYMSFFFIALISSSIIIWVFQAVNFLDIMIEDGRGYLTYIKYSLLNFPKIVSRLLPFVLFFSIFYVTIKHEFNNELLIFWNFGINKIEIINLILKFSFILFLFQSLLTLIIVPISQDLARSFLRDSSLNLYENFVKPQRFNDTIKGITIYTENKNENGELLNLYLKKEINQNEFQIIYAKRGLFKKNKNTNILVLYDGEQLNSKNNQITNINFSKSDFPLLNVETNTTLSKKTQEINSYKLFKCLHLLFFLKSKEKNNIENCNLRNIENIFRELYKRVILPFYIPLLMLIPFFLLFKSKESSIYLKLRIFTFLIGLSIVILSEVSIKLISKIFINNMFFAFTPLMLIIFLYFIFYNQFKSHFKLK